MFFKKFPPWLAPIADNNWKYEIILIEEVKKKPPKTKKQPQLR